MYGPLQVRLLVWLMPVTRWLVDQSATSKIERLVRQLHQISTTRTLLKLQPRNSKLNIPLTFRQGDIIFLL